MRNLGNIASSPISTPLSPTRKIDKDRKFMELYEEAKQRKERLEKVQAELLDKECTFKPHLVTKDSKLTASILQECMGHIDPSSSGQQMNLALNNNQTVTPIRFSASGTTSGNTSLVVFDRLA